MTTNLTPGKQAFLFTVIVMAMGLALVPVARMLGEPILILYMFTPTFAVLAMLFVFTKDGRKPGIVTELGLRPSGRSYWAYATLATMAVSVIGLLVAVALPSAHLITPHRWYLLPIDLTIQIVAASLTMCLGEELGWRGYLQPRLSHLGEFKSMLVVGVIHGTWHMPIILAASNVHYIDGNRLLIVPLFYVTIIGGGLFFGLLRLYSKSVWPASIAHAAHNAAWNFTGSFMAATGFTAGSYVAGDAGIVIALGVWVGAAGLWLWHNRRPHTRSVATPTTTIALPA